jgi:hypothetical protein
MNNKIKIWLLWEWLDNATQDWLQDNGKQLGTDTKIADSNVEQWEIGLEMPREILKDLANAMPFKMAQKMVFRLDTWHVSLDDFVFAQDFIDTVGERISTDNTPNDSHRIIEFPVKSLLLASDEVKRELFEVGEFKLK